MKANEIKKIITTGPPHSMHLIGLELKKKDPSLRWIADFRDPWSEWDLLDTLSLTQWARKRHQALEKKVLTTADEVITIAPFHVTRLEALSGRKVQLITNGFDEDDFAGIVHKKTSRFTIRHVGVVDELRDPRPVMEAVKSLCLENPEFANNVLIEFIGNVNSAFKNYVAGDEQLNKVTRFVDQMPHSELLKLYGETDLQLLVLAHTAIAPGNLPGKFFEYLASGNPILAIGPTEGDAAHVLKETEAGKIFERESIEEIKISLAESFAKWPDKNSTGRSAIYSRSSLTHQLIELLNDSFH
ncbi:MAG: glycosyl transferase [Cyclobacteriaceae bacterium]|nr:glycosyl transferase [Cyclobacteriaceae bacterium]